MTETKVVKRHTEATAIVDTFWNRERVKRGIKYSDVSKKFGKSQGTVAKWFIGKSVPNDEIISELCYWFTIGHDIIMFDEGKQAFIDAHAKYEAASSKTVIARADEKIVETMETRPMTIKFLLRDRKYSFRKLAKELKVTVTMIRNWVNGQAVPNDVYLDKMADILDFDSVKLGDLFADAYYKAHNVEGQMDIIEAQEQKEPDPMDEDAKEASIPDAEAWTDDVMSRIRNTEITITPGIRDTLKKMDEDAKEASILDKALEKFTEQSSDRDRLVQWFQLLTGISPVRITDTEIIEIMTHYISMDYSMFNALEAWHNEDNPNYIHERYVILQCDRVHWLGEDYER